MSFGNNLTLEILCKAEKDSYSILAQCYYDAHSVIGVVCAAECKKSPAIIQIFSVTLDYGKGPILLECTDEENINIALARPHVERAARAGIAVNVERGRLEGGEAGLRVVSDAKLTDAAKAESAAILAPSVGNLHGSYLNPPDFRQEMYVSHVFQEAKSAIQFYFALHINIDTLNVKRHDLLLKELLDVSCSLRRLSTFNTSLNMPAILARIGRDFDATSEAVDEVNKLKSRIWEETSEFDAEKDKTHFRNYEEACDRVKDFYREQHEKQTVEFNIKTRANIRKTVRARMGVWEAMEKLNTLVDASDPDTELSQIEHLLQTAEAIRRDGKPEWMQVVGLVHDLGKLLYIFGSEGQWDVVGDTFVVGCAFSDKNVYPETFAGNPNSHDPVYASKYGIYKPGCGLENVMLSWGHDEYLYHIFKEQSTLPEEGLAMIRYHSFYPWHREGAYTHLTNAHDMKLLAAVRAFNPYDLYSKSDEPVDPAALRPYYENLIQKFFPEVIEW
ncbi:hypothetical protein EW145_g6957 [Phellinidium pouzarii]|uniref:Fructose-bisphosphate aldolase n=1 Tax=Phellinidium pouzarii TaxID=167371 RepID=A0A4S4KSA8_9AGAM|nr:hypothetical protein EW145_g6957 [Phellinidium pouzarii]